MIDLKNVSTEDLISEISNRSRWTAIFNSSEAHIGEYVKLFQVAPDSAAWYYGMFACEARVYVCRMKRGEVVTYYAVISFPSIDDSFIGLYGPEEHQEKAARRASMLKDEFENVDYVPNMEFFERVSKKTGTFVNSN